MAEELLIFVGYSDDAEEEALAVRELQPRLQIRLEHLNQVASSHKYSTLKVFNWKYDAKLGIGGQSFAISTELKRAGVAVFIFKERIGSVTWKELNDCRERESEERIPIITLFPANHPNPERMNLLENVEAWSDLLKKRKELTEDWVETNSRSVTPIEPYRDKEHLQQILIERLEDILPQLIRGENEPRHIPDLSQVVPHSPLTTLDQITDQTEYSSQAVQQYRSDLRVEARSRFPPELTDTEFLLKAGYLKGGRLTTVGVLLFASQPSQSIPSAVIRCAKYDGVDKATSRTRRPCDGHLLSQILEARDFIEENTGNRERPSESSMQSRKVYQYPMICVREVLANAACHRDYEDSKRSIYVTIYKDRIEIKSPGQWFNASWAEGETIHLRELASESVQRNMRLAQAIASVNMMEMEGSGIPTSIQDCLEHGAPEPTVDQRDGYIVVTIYPSPDWDDVPRQVDGKDATPDQKAALTKALLSMIPRPPLFGFVARRDAQGRDIVERLREELAPGRNQLVTLSGPGGIGKTTLAAEAARELQEAYGGRVVWSSALGRADFSLPSLLDDIATQLGHAELRTLAPVEKEEQVRALVADALVVLDNYETVAAAEQKRIEAWFARTQCSALFTSRPKVEGTVFVPVSAMAREEAAEFLEKLAAQTQDPQIFTREVRERVYETAEANPFVMQWVVGQIDLAQEPGAVLEELKHGGGDAARRVFDRSFELPLLGDDGRDTLLALSLFAPSAKVDALAAAAGFDDAGRASEAVKNLRRLWLVKGVDGNRRLAVEGLTRTLAAARLSRDPRADEFRCRFVAYFLRYAVERIGPTPVNYDALEEDKDNLLRAAEAAFTYEDWDSVTRMAYALAAPVDGMLSVRGYWGEAVKLGEQALQAARSFQDEANIAGLSHNLATMYQSRGELAEARRLYGESLEIEKRLGNKGGVAISLHQLGMLAQEQGELEEARRLYAESLEINKGLGNQNGVAITLHNLAALAHGEGDLEEARRLYGESLEIDKSLGDQGGVAISLHQLGVLAQSRGEFDEARRLYDRSLQISKRLGDQINIANTLHQLGMIALSQGDLEEGRRLYDEGLGIRRKLGNQSGIANSLHYLGLLAEVEGNKTEAARLFREALIIWNKLRAPEAEKVRRDLERVEAGWRG